MIFKESLPEKFTFPFYYQPHSLAIIAAKEIQVYLEKQTDFIHNFGIKKDSNTPPVGKMFGVLVVRNKLNEIGYLAAFSGKLADKSLPSKFVPPVFNMRTEGSFYIKGEAEIDKINEQLGILKKDGKYLSIKKTAKKLHKEIADDLELQRKKMRISKSERKIIKKISEKKLNANEFEKLTNKLTQESYNDQFFYKELQEYYTTKLEKISTELAFF